MNKLGATKKGTELLYGEYGQYTTMEHFKVEGFEGRTYPFTCVGFHGGKAIIETDKGYLHKKGDECVFMIMGCEEGL